MEILNGYGDFSLDNNLATLSSSHCKMIVGLKTLTVKKRYYLEINVLTTGHALAIGLIDKSIDLSSDSSYLNYNTSVNSNIFGTGGVNTLTFANNDIVGIGFDTIDNSISFYKNNILIKSFSTSLTLDNVALVLGCGSNNTSTSPSKVQITTKPKIKPDGYMNWSLLQTMALQNPTTNQIYSLTDNTLIHLPDASDKNMILHGIEQGKEIQLDVDFDKVRYINNTPVANTNGKTFTQEIGKLNALKISEVK